jgi:hypothetical protein
VRAGQWTRLLIKSFSNITEKVWMARNGIFHGKDKKENLAMKKANLVREIDRAFAIHPTSLRAVDRTLLTGNSKIAMLQTSYQNQFAWLGSVRSAMFAAAFAGRQTTTTNEPGYLPMGDGRVINPIDRGEASLHDQQQPSNRRCHYLAPRVRPEASM